MESLSSQLGGLSVGSSNQRLKSKRSQRFTVPTQQQQSQHPQSAGSPSESNSNTDSGVALSSYNGSANSNSNGNGSNQGFVYPGAAAEPFPGVGNINNNIDHVSGAMMSPLGAATLPSFLQHDPFAYAGAAGGAGQQPVSSRQRTLSAGANSVNGAQSLPSWANLPVGLSNGTVSPPTGTSGTFSPFGNLGAGSPVPVPSTVLQGMYSPPTHSPYSMLEHIHPQQQQHQQQQQQQMGGPSQAPSSDDIIPTAIVIKNIPFAFPSTSLLQIIEELTLSPPYAFNYHYDNGTFRGLAFANFHTPQETDACVAALNGFEISGRKLRVEYKKVLQAGEKERIERDKAIKRMRSMQLERERLINQHQMHAHAHAQQQQQHQEFQQQQHQYAQFAQQQQQQPYMQSGQGLQHQQNRGSAIDDEYEDYGKPIAATFGIAGSPALSGPSQGNAPSIGGSSSGVGPPSATGGSTELDMNDPVTLEIYSRVLLFKDDALRDELAFSRALSATQRRVVHVIAQRLGLEHRSVGVGEDRFVVIVKPPSSNGDAGGEHRSLRTKASAGGFLGAGGAGVIGNGYAAASRKKSMPDLRGGGQQYGGYPAPPIGTMPQLSTANLASLGFGPSATGAAPGSSLPFLPSAGGAVGGPTSLMSAGFSPTLEDPHPASGTTSPSNGVATRHSNHDLRRPRSAFYGAADFASVPPVPALPGQTQTQSTGSGSAGSLGDMLGNKAVGSPIGGNGSQAQAQAQRQPKGPDGQGSWARAAGAPPGL